MTADPSAVAVGLDNTRSRHDEQTDDQDSNNERVRTTDTQRHHDNSASIERVITDECRHTSQVTTMDEQPQQTDHVTSNSKCSNSDDMVVDRDLSRDNITSPDNDPHIDPSAVVADKDLSLDNITSPENDPHKDLSLDNITSPENDPHKDLSRDNITSPDNDPHIDPSAVVADKDLSRDNITSPENDPHIDPSAVVVDRDLSLDNITSPENDPHKDLSRDNITSPENDPHKDLSRDNITSPENDPHIDLSRDNITSPENDPHIDPSAVVADRDLSRDNITSPENDPHKDLSRDNITSPENDPHKDLSRDNITSPENDPHIDLSRDNITSPENDPHKDLSRDNITSPENDPHIDSSAVRQRPHCEVIGLSASSDTVSSDGEAKLPTNQSNDPHIPTQDGVDCIGTTRLSAQNETLGSCGREAPLVPNNRPNGAGHDKALDDVDMEANDDMTSHRTHIVNVPNDVDSKTDVDDDMKSHWKHSVKALNAVDSEADDDDDMKSHWKHSVKAPNAVDSKTDVDDDMKSHRKHSVKALNAVDSDAGDDDEMPSHRKHSVKALNAVDSEADDDDNMKSHRKHSVKALNAVDSEADDDDDMTSHRTHFCCCCGLCSAETEPANQRVVFRWYDLPFELASSALYVFDVYTDIRLAVQFLLEGHLRYGCVTLSFVVLSYAVMVGYVVKEYVRHRRSKDDVNAAPRAVWALRLLCTVLMLGPIVNTVEYIYSGCKSRNMHCEERELFLRRMKTHHINNAFLRLFEACLEAAPQLVFQLYVLVVTQPALQGLDGAWRVLTVLSSWFSLALTLTAFSKSRRNTDDCLRPATLRHQTFDFLWRLAETGGRVLCIALFTSVFRFWLLAVLVPHGVIMAAWQFLQERTVSLLTFLECLVYAYVFQFCFINNYSGGYSRVQYLVFYVLFYAESVSMLGLWYWYTPDQGAWFHEAGLIAGLVTLPLHVFLQLFYYKCCHPSSHIIRVAMPGDRVIWKQHLIGPYTPKLCDVDLDDV